MRKGMIANSWQKEKGEVGPRDQRQLALILEKRAQSRLSFRHWDDIRLRRIIPPSR